MSSSDRPRGLDAFFRPRGVAVVGASRNPAKVGHAVLRNLLYGSGKKSDRSQGYPGWIVPVHPTEQEVLGLTAAPLASLGGEIDLAVFAIPAAQTPQALDQAARKGVRAAIVLAAGFFEMGPEGRRLGEQLRTVAQNSGVRLIGPNCTGIFAGRSQLSASFFSVAPHLGSTTLLSQSGAIAQALVQQSNSDRIGLRNVVSLGDRADVKFPELLRYFRNEDETRVISLYLESLSDARDFHEAARETAPHKPLVVLRGGRTGAGHRAAKRHEGLDAMRDSALDSALAYPGIYRTHTLPGFLAAIHALSTQPPAAGRRVAIVTNAGGAGVIAADSAADAGLEVVKLRPDVRQKLKKIARNPRAWTNPVDLLGDAHPNDFVAALEAVSKSPDVDSLLLVLTDQAMTDPLEVAVQVCDYARTLRKPIVVSFVGQVAQESEFYLSQYGIPDFVFPELAVEGLRALAARGAYERRLSRKPERTRRIQAGTGRNWWKDSSVFQRGAD